jgi:hypothetical protein
MGALRKEAHPMEQGLTLAPELRRASGYECADPDCEATIYYGEEAVLVQVALVQQGDGELLKYPVLDEDDPARDFLFEPHYFCTECWQKTYDFIMEALADTPPVQDTVVNKLGCDCCGSGIRECLEYTGVAEVGEFRRSRRSPDRLYGPRFEPTSNPMLLCLSCLLVISEGHIELWDNLTQTDECIDCSTARCWRAPCSCTCHSTETP